MENRELERCKRLADAFNSVLNDRGYFVMGNARGYIVVGDMDEHGFGVQLPCFSADELEDTLKEQYALLRMLELTESLPEAEYEGRVNVAVRMSNPYFGLDRDGQKIVQGEIERIMSFV